MKIIPLAHHGGTVELELQSTGNIDDGAGIGGGIIATPGYMAVGADQHQSVFV